MIVHLIMADVITVNMFLSFKFNIVNQFEIKEIQYCKSVTDSWRVLGKACLT